MKLLKKGDYLTPETEVMEIRPASVLLQSGDIEDSSENPETPW